MTSKSIGLGLSFCCLLLWSSSAFAANHQGNRRGQPQQHISQGYARSHVTKAELRSQAQHRKDVVVVKKIVQHNRPLRYSSNHGRKGAMDLNVYRHKQAHPGSYCGARCVPKGRPKRCAAPPRYTRVGNSFVGALNQPGVALSWNVLLK